MGHANRPRQSRSPDGAWPSGSRRRRAAGGVARLDAAHILPDGHPQGEPIVPNGLALCKLHHAAFDRHFLGIRPDLVIEVRRDIMDEADGPMLRYGLQGFDGARIHAPRAAALRPAERFLAERFEVFRQAG